MYHRMSYIVIEFGAGHFATPAVGLRWATLDETLRSEGESCQNCCGAQLEPSESMRRAEMFVDVSFINYRFFYDAAG